MSTQFLQDNVDDNNNNCSNATTTCVQGPQELNTLQLFINNFVDSDFEGYDSNQHNSSQVSLL